MVRLFSGDRVEPFRRGDLGQRLHGDLAAVVGVDDATRDVEKPWDAHDVVANVVVQLIVARRRRAIIDRHQMRVIGAGVDDPQVAAEVPLLAVFEHDRIPPLAVVWRFDQRKCEIAQRALVLGEIVERNRPAGVQRGFLPNPGVNVIGDGRRLYVA